MANKMLIDASHPEETRVVLLRGNRVEDFDFEAADKKQLRGNIYLAKVTRVEPSLQAAFVDYGGNRHGFLAFSEIHPDYYQIPVADRQALLEEEARAHEEEEDESRSPRRSRRHRRDRNGGRAEKRRTAGDETISETESAAAPDESLTPTDVIVADESGGTMPLAAPDTSGSEAVKVESDAGVTGAEPAPQAASDAEVVHVTEELLAEGDGDGGAAAAHVPEIEMSADDTAAGEHLADAPAEGTSAAGAQTDDAVGEESVDEDDDEAEGEDAEAEHVEQIGGDDLEEVQRRMPRLRKQYKIQEVIKRRQVLLVQVVKEERGNKGAALTTYLSLAGRYSVLMPNTAKGGGISRKITDAGDRTRLKAIAQDLEVPEGMGVILRTAGASRTNQEVRRDFEYLLRMWETVRETTLSSSAPTLTYEEGSLIKRSIRDLYNKDIDDIVVAGEAGYREARDFMRLLMPTQTRAVQAYHDPQPLYAKYGVEAQLDAMFSTQVTLKSGGYIVINQTEALVAVDVNSGRSTREHDIEDTALRTNLEAADELARQLRLRDLAGLIVVDFIDMDENRNNRAVERRLKDALKEDRARIQVGRISHFGLLEMSRQRMRTGVFEGSAVPCPHCAGAGMVRSTSSIALHVLRVLEDNLIKSASHNLTLRTRMAVGLYMLNQKRTHLRDLEARFGITVSVAIDETLTGTTYHAIERGEPASGPTTELRAPPAYDDAQDDVPVEEIESDEGTADETANRPTEQREGEGEPRRGRRRRRRGRDRESSGIEAGAPQPSDDALSALAGDGTAAQLPANDEPDEAADEAAEGASGDDRAPRRRRRSRRGRGGRDPRDVMADEAGTGELGADEADTGETEAETTGGNASLDVVARDPIAPASVGIAPTDISPLTSAAAPSAAESIPPILADPEPAPTAPAMLAPMPAPTAAPASDQPEAPGASQEELDPSRPKRTGWWQRAKATLRG